MIVAAAVSVAAAVGAAAVRSVRTLRAVNAAARAERWSNGKVPAQYDY